MKTKTTMLKYFVAATVLFLAVNLHAGDEPKTDKYSTDGYMNGRAWATSTASQRGDYMLGFYEALAATGELKAPSPYPCQECTPNQIASGVTEFYAASSARDRLPIPYAVQMAVRRIQGWTAAQVDEQASMWLRNLAASEK